MYEIEACGQMLKVTTDNDYVPRKFEKAFKNCHISELPGPIWEVLILPSPGDTFLIPTSDEGS
jgi:hypothetical protein